MRGKSDDASEGATVAGKNGREPKWTRHPRAETTERILDAAEDLFSRRDPDKVTVREIAAKAGVTHPVVHEYVGSKAEIVAAVIARGAPRRQQLMTEHPDFFEALPLVSWDVLSRRVHSRSVVRAAMDDRRYDALEDRIRSGEMLLALARKAIDEGAQRPRPPPPSIRGSLSPRRRRWSTGGWRWRTGWCSSTTSWTRTPPSCAAGLSSCFRRSRVIIVGGVAGGASCAARLRRLDETAEILMVERGPYVSYANCGLPYHVGGVIVARVQPHRGWDERVFRTNFNVDVRTRCEAIAISRRKTKTVQLRNGRDRCGDHPVLRQARPVAGRYANQPATPGHRAAGRVFGVRTVPDVSRRFARWIEGPHGPALGHGCLHGLPDTAAGPACRGGRRRLHRPRNGGKPGAPRPAGDAAATGRPALGAHGPGNGGLRRTPPGQERRQPRPQCQRMRIPADGAGCARGA